jgi:hypothetical protein
MSNLESVCEQSMFEDSSDTYADYSSSFGLGSDVASDARGGFGDVWPRHLREAIECCPSASSDQLRSLLNRCLARAVVLAKIFWASTWSVWGLAVGCLGLLTGGGVQRSGRILEFWGGRFLPLFLRTFPFIAGSPVATFGHVVVGRTQRHLEACRPHQLVHVRQYECWGPLFVPTYLTWWFVLWCCGKRPYYDNPFEREAFDETA